MIVFLICTILQIIVANASESPLNKIVEKRMPKDGLYNFTQLATEYGLHAEEIEVTTEDGYILTIFHIPGKKRPLVFLHGIGDTANTWLLRGEKSLGFALAGEGHDLWFGNVRGNPYGRKHTRLNPDTDAEFWDFSFNEIGFYDWPAVIDRVLKETNENKLNVIGHSQGTTSFFVLMSTRPHYNKKINLMIALAPVAFLDHPGPLLSALGAAGPIISGALKLQGINELFKDHGSEKLLEKLLCSQGIIGENFCGMNIMFPIAGYNTDGIEPQFMSTIMGQFPAGVSRKSLEHYDQIMLSGRFAKYDNGVFINEAVYGSEKPPEYDLSKVSAKVALLYGENDLMASPKDVLHLAKLLPNVVYMKAIDNKKWNHIDFLWNSQMKKYLFGHITTLLEKYDW